MITLTEIISYILKKAWEEIKRITKPMPIICLKGGKND
tara:strand:- start:664 stop:777 length:114 start_codon:yes stop_codon:yes gene_type:complete